MRRKFKGKAPNAFHQARNFEITSRFIYNVLPVGAATRECETPGQAVLSH
jgi:hypothetical protein